MRELYFVILLAFNLIAASALGDDLVTPAFHSAEGRERVVTFDGRFRSGLTNLEAVAAMDESQKLAFRRDQIEPVLKFLFGPLTRRNMASPQRGMEVKVAWERAALMNGRVELPYEYRGLWIVDKDLPAAFPLPVPLAREGLKSPRWKSCTDSDPEHQTDWFYWYFWDPARYGCDHKEGVQYQVVSVRLGEETQNQSDTYPEYKRLVRDGRMQLTFAFGYVKDPSDPQPETDFDSGILEYRDFVARVRKDFGASFRETKILQKEYRGARDPAKVIGRRFEGSLRGMRITLNVVAAAGVDQMELFAKSFAHDHDGFFGWFGHSRVGSGFDAEQFWQMKLRNPEYYSVSTDYQIVYWGGCNSYSYYTLPFFEFKEQAANGLDPGGTKGLDIIANGLPSYFHFNADNAEIALRHLLAWEARASYQTIIGELEARAQREGVDVLVAVLGDEDNPRD